MLLRLTHKQQKKQESISYIYIPVYIYIYLYMDSLNGFIFSRVTLRLCIVFCFGVVLVSFRSSYKHPEPFSSPQLTIFASPVWSSFPACFHLIFFLFFSAAAAKLFCLKVCQHEKKLPLSSHFWSCFKFSKHNECTEWCDTHVILDMFGHRVTHFFVYCSILFFRSIFFFGCLMLFWLCICFIFFFVLSLKSSFFSPFLVWFVRFRSHGTVLALIFFCCWW